jgi:ATPase subunit of ABC transporter with duplicated ATPase domains
LYVARVVEAATSMGGRRGSRRYSTADMGPFCCCGAQLELVKELEDTEKALEGCIDDMDRMQELIEKMGALQAKMDNVDMFEVDKQIEVMMSSMGFKEEDNDRLVASYSGGWQMRMSLGKILLQNPDLLLLDEPTNHLDLETVEWLEKYLKEQSVPMVIVSHDRAFLDQLCTKIVETERGVSKTWRGNYSEYLAQKQAWITAQVRAGARAGLIQRTGAVNDVLGWCTPAPRLPGPSTLVAQRVGN